MSAPPDIAAFRAEVRAFLAAELPPALAERANCGYYLSKEELLSWHRALHRRGWIAPNWPVEHGGPGWTPLQKYVFEDECAQAGAPILIMMALNQVGALLTRFGTEAQQRRFLPRILDGSEMWCLGFSEPHSGSDLASLRCKAVREGDHYVVTGGKIWTTIAHWAEWCFLLVRTSQGERKQEGITILLMDMKSPGITIRPIISLDGMHSLNEIFLDEVRIPVANRVGEEDRGWEVMRVVLGHERLSAASIGKCKAFHARLCAIARREKRGGRPLIEQPRFRDKLAWLDMRIRALDAILLRLVGSAVQSQGIEPALLKLRGTEVQQEALRLTSEAAGHYGLPFHPAVLRDGWAEEPIGPDFAAPATPYYLFWRKSTISGGSSEMMRNAIASALLG